FFPSSYTETITGRMFDSVHGYVDVTTVVPLVFSSINQLFPGNGQLLFTGAASARIRVTTLSAVLVKVELDLDGNSVYETAATLKWTDLGGPVGADLGDADADGMHNSWETANGLNLSNAADAALDKDNDGFTNLQEYLVGTDPSNAGSIPPSADLAITMTDAPDPVAIGGTFSYSITVVNWGPAAAPDVVVTDVLPAGLNLVSVTTSLGACTGTSTVTCNLGTLALGWSATINLSVTASTAGLYNNTASVVSSAAEGNSTNNSATATTTVGSSAGSLQSLIDVAGPGDTVLVPSGLYVGGIDFNSKNITLARISGSASTILHGNNGTAVRMGPGGTIRGFTITGANASFGAGIEVIGSGSVISRNIFDGNMQSAGGFGAAIGGNSASPMIERNIFRNNGCDTQFLSGVVAFVNGSSPTIVNNLFVNNPCRGINLSLPQGNTPQIMNNTFVGNSVAIRVDRRVSQITQTYRNNILFQNGIGLEVEFGSESDNPVWGNNLVFSNTTNYQGIANPTGLNSNISANPLFVSASAVDYHLLAGSPAIDAGSTLGAPSIDFDGTSRPLDGNGDSTPSFDIGAFEFSP
ncbi:MAG: choice-of-anchor Q domain-containing protein, partial [Pseudomonadota bacterium]